MVGIVWFSIPTNDFVFESALATTEKMEIDLATIVSTENSGIPNFCATGQASKRSGDNLWKRSNSRESRNSTG